MTEEEKKAEEYSDTTYTDWCSDNGYPDCDKNCMKCVRKQSYIDGYEQGMKKVCDICEQHMLEEHPNACGCAFRRLGNEYCWEFKKDEKA